VKYLLDTHTLLWLEGDLAKLSKMVSEICFNPFNVLLLSAASFWEIQIKSRNGNLSVPPTLLHYLTMQKGAYNYEWLPIQPTHLVAYSRTPVFHKDPFDLMLITQAIAESVPILSHDEKFSKYPVSIIW
jgi:PIN domain nuclease of toxin-antitoxin system